MATKRILYVNRRPPHGSIYAQEALDVVLIGAAFEQRVSVAFLDDGVWQLMSEQHPAAIDGKDFAKGFRALEMYDVEHVYVERESLERRGLTVDGLLMAVEVVSQAALAQLLEEHDVVLTF